MYPEARVDRRTACRARFLGAGARSLSGEVVDVSPTGLCLRLDEALPQGRELHLEFDLPSGRVEAVGEVRWVKEQQGRAELGVRFVRISAESLAVIQTQATPVGAAGGGWTGLRLR